MSSNNTTIMTSNQQESVAGQKAAEEVYLNTAPLGSLRIPSAAAFEVTATDANDNPTEIEYYNDAAGTELIATLTLTYDASDNIVTGSVTYP